MLKYLKVLFLVLIFFTFSHSADAATVELRGYMWSSTIGYVSFGSSTLSSGGGNYGVVMDTTTKDLTGYAWSPNIGWIRFGGLTGFPSSAGNGTNAQNAKVNGAGKFQGWVRACSVLADKATCSGTQLDPSTATGGWDGWISLSGSNYGLEENNSGTPLTVHDPKAFTWGNEIVGWLRGEYNTNGTCDPFTEICGDNIVDICNNIAGNQATMPSGYTSDGAGGCRLTRCNDATDQAGSDEIDTLNNYPADPGCSSIDDDDERCTDTSINNADGSCSGIVCPTEAAACSAWNPSVCSPGVTQTRTCTVPTGCPQFTQSNSCPLVTVTEPTVTLKVGSITTNPSNNPALNSPNMDTYEPPTSGNNPVSAKFRLNIGNSVGLTTKCSYSVNNTDPVNFNINISSAPLTPPNGNSIFTISTIPGNVDGTYDFKVTCHNEDVNGVSGSDVFDVVRVRVNKGTGI